MGQHQGAFDILISKIVGFISVGSYLKYNTPNRSYTEINALADDNVIPNVAYVKGAIAVLSGEVKVPITTNPQSYTYTGSLEFPRIRFSQVQGDGLRHPTYADFAYNPGTKVITFALEVTDVNVAWVS